MNILIIVVISPYRLSCDSRSIAVTDKDTCVMGEVEKEIAPLWGGDGVSTDMEEGQVTHDNTHGHINTGAGGGW